MRHLIATRGTTITLTWKETTGGTVDPVTGAVLNPTTETTKTSTTKGLMHFVSASTKLRQYAEIEEGDLLVDLDPEVNLESKPGLRFTVEGRIYVQKEISSKLTQVWDAVFSGVRMTRTLLLRLAT